MTDADPETQELGAAVPDDVTQPVVPGMAAALLVAQLSRRKVQLVVEHRDIGGRELEEPQCLAQLRDHNRTLGIVLEQGDRYRGMVSTNSLTRAIESQPDLVLDPAKTPPKVLRALELARRAAGRSR